MAYFQEVRERLVPRRASSGISAGSAGAPPVANASQLVGQLRMVCAGPLSVTLERSGLFVAVIRTIAFAETMPDVARMVAYPEETPVTTPVVLTVATDGVSLVHSTA